MSRLGDMQSGAVQPGEGLKAGSSETMFFNADGTKTGESEAVSAPALGRRHERTAPAKPPEPHKDVSPEEQAEDLADLIHEKFIHLLRDRLAANDGYLNEEDVEEMSQELRAQLDDVREVFLAAVRSQQSGKVDDRDHNERELAFQRLMIHRFENRFAPDEVVAKDPRRLSRRMLPGFLSALSLLLGPQNLTRYQNKANTVKNALKDKMGDAFSWEHVYASTNAKKVALRAQIDIAEHFQHVDKRIAWLVALVNSNLIPSAAGAPATNWSLDEQGARNLLRDLFADLVTAMANKAAREALTRELGEDRVNGLKRMLKKLF